MNDILDCALYLGNGQFKKLTREEFLAIPFHELVQKPYVLRLTDTEKASYFSEKEAFSYLKSTGKAVYRTTDLIQSYKQELVRHGLNIKDSIKNWTFAYLRSMRAALKEFPGARFV